MMDIKGGLKMKRFIKMVLLVVIGVFCLEHVYVYANVELNDAVYVTTEDAFIKEFAFKENTITVTVDTSSDYKLDFINMLQFEESALLKHINPNLKPEEIEKQRKELGLSNVNATEFVESISSALTGQEMIKQVRELVPGVYLMGDSDGNIVFYINGLETSEQDNRVYFKLFKETLFELEEVDNESFVYKGIKYTRQ